MRGPTTETARADGETHAAFASVRGHDETFAELVSRLLRERRDAVWNR